MRYKARRKTTKGTRVKDSSAARNGLLINHQLVEVNGQNVVGLKDEVRGGDGV